MELLPSKTPGIVKKMFPGLVWYIPASGTKIYLTFDDGPIPEITPFVLETLNNYNAKATFFCIGENAKKNPEILQNIVLSGHALGNHTQNHLNGWKTSTKKYIENIIEADVTFRSILDNKPYSKGKVTLFRPPYGKITPLQIKALQKLGYKIIMWDILPRDWKSTITPQECLDTTLKNTENGSIIVFHDSLKAFRNMQYALPKVLAYFTKKGYSFERIDNKCI